MVVAGGDMSVSDDSLWQPSSSFRALGHVITDTGAVSEDWEDCSAACWRALFATCMHRHVRSLGSATMARRA